MRDAIIGAFEADMTEVELVVPYGAGRAMSEIHEYPRDLGVLRGGRRALARVKAPEAAIERIRAMLR